MECMKAVVWYGARDVRVEDVASGLPDAGEVAIGVAYRGICGSDLHDVVQRGFRALLDTKDEIKILVRP
jgi:threonine dehydrogenase-like Zn-dependent dehydrogenase